MHPGDGGKKAGRRMTRWRSKRRGRGLGGVRIVSSALDGGGRGVKGWAGKSGGPAHKSPRSGHARHLCPPLSPPSAPPPLPLCPPGPSVCTGPPSMIMARAADHSLQPAVSGNAMPFSPSSIKTERASVLSSIRTHESLWSGHGSNLVQVRVGGGFSDCTWINRWCCELSWPRRL